MYGCPVLCASQVQCPNTTTNNNLHRSDVDKVSCVCRRKPLIIFRKHTNNFLVMYDIYYANSSWVLVFVVWRKHEAAHCPLVRPRYPARALYVRRWVGGRWTFRRIEKDSRPGEGVTATAASASASQYQKLYTYTHKNVFITNTYGRTSDRVRVRQHTICMQKIRGTRIGGMCEEAKRRKRRWWSWDRRFWGGWTDECENLSCWCTTPHSLSCAHTHAYPHTHTRTRTHSNTQTNTLV